MSARHTPGPWSYKDNPYGNSAIRGADGRLVAHVFGDDAQEQADALLIAAAPELLEQLQEVLRRIQASDEWWMDCPDRGGFDATAITAVIAKATGEGA